MRIYVDDYLDRLTYSSMKRAAFKAISGIKTRRTLEQWEEFRIDFESNMWELPDGDEEEVVAERPFIFDFVYTKKQVDSFLGDKKGATGTAEGAEIFNDLKQNKATGVYSHAEGQYTIASGIFSHAEGQRTTASGQFSHAEGMGNTATQMGAHAEGMNTNATEIQSHAEGSGTTASGTSSHAEGMGTTSSGSSSHAEGMGSTASGMCGHSEGYNTKALGSNSHAEGSGTKAEQTGDHAEGVSTVASGSASHAEGTRTKASGQSSHAEGQDTEASGYPASHAEGGTTKATGTFSHAEGFTTSASGMTSHSEGQNTIASGTFSHAQGYKTEASAYATHTGGFNTKASTPYSTVIGLSNVRSADIGGAVSTFDPSYNLLVIGNGTVKADVLSNAFRVDGTGKVYAASTFNSAGADYAEYFEWLDSNPEDEDRVGRFVTLEGDKIRLASKEDDYLVGIISATASILGDAYEDQWNGMYLRDEFGRFIIEEQEITVPVMKQGTETVEHSVSISDSKTGKPVQSVVTYEQTVVAEEEVVVTQIVNKVNPSYDSTLEYIPRSKRKEWDAVGMLGKLLVKDDGTCEINGYCYPGEDGIATKSEIGYRVVQRVSDNIIKVIFR